MAKQAWQSALSDDELRLSALGARPARARGLWRWLGRLFVIAALTLAGAYYLPLYRAHAALARDHESLVQKSETLQQNLGRAQQELIPLKAKQDRLEAQRRSTHDHEKAAQGRFDQLKTALATKLARHVSKGTVALTEHTGRPVISLPEHAVPDAETGKPTAAATAALCDLATLVKGSGSFKLEVTAYAESNASSEPARPPPANAWTPAFNRAASVVQALGERCRYPTERMAAIAMARAPRTDGVVRVEIVPQ